MTDDLECLDKIRKHLKNALVNLYEVGDWIQKREKDYYQWCCGFSKLIHQVENLCQQYDYEYLRKKEGGE